MNKIKVLHTEWSGGWGGQEIRILNEMLALREQGVEVLLASTAHAQLTQQAQKQGIRCFHLPFGGNADLKTLWGLFKIIKEHKIDIVNTHSGKDTWVGGIAAKMAGAKFIRTRHLSNAIGSSRLNFINEMADYIITTGESVRSAMIQNNRINPAKISSVPSGINQILFDPIKYNRSALREKFKIGNDEIAIGIVAVLRRFKRHDLFVEMAREIIKEFPRTKFFIAGEGPQQEAIREKIHHYDLGHKIIMTGHLDQSAELLAALDIFTLSSDGFEGVPQSVIQALFMKCAVIATDAGSTQDLWHQDNFKLIKAGDLDELIASVRSLVQEPSLRIQYADKARDFAVAHFSEQEMVQKLLSIYNRLLA